ncbi:MAG: hypothetical protein P857_766 [Candidatus Xenolissoclinum pacificiensis L6]|uniref:PD-(D/E)XK endonuclease-like domain-containing protein n=1 Tax=Candidatus Xenolissoclinum pacificiensis L6 TaxID=1401685 RepID=W2UYV6_9RICK|nr:MAG: hypothetical protein P857_766 [Candidatus Xenolissoclinum pacificiensis L6]
MISVTCVFERSTDNTLYVLHVKRYDEYWFIMELIMTEYINIYTHQDIFSYISNMCREKNTDNLYRNILIIPNNHVKNQVIDEFKLLNQSIILPRIITINTIVRNYSIINSLQMPTAIGQAIALYKKNPKININSYYNIITQIFYNNDYSIDSLEISDALIKELETLYTEQYQYLVHQALKLFVSTLVADERLYMIIQDYPNVIDETILEIITQHNNSHIIFLNHDINTIPFAVNEIFSYDRTRNISIHQIVCKSETDMLRDLKFIINTHYPNITIISDHHSLLNVLDKALVPCRLSLKRTKPIIYSSIYSLIIQIIKFIGDPNKQSLLSIFKHPILFKKYYQDILVFERFYLQRSEVKFKDFLFSFPSNVIHIFIQEIERKEFSNFVQKALHIIRTLIAEELYKHIDATVIQQFILATADIDNLSMLLDIISFFFRNTYTTHKYAFSNPINVLSPRNACMFNENHTVIVINFEHEKYKSHMRNIDHLLNSVEKIILVNSEEVPISNFFKGYPVHQIDNTDWVYNDKYIQPYVYRSISNFCYTITKPVVLTASMFQLFINQPELFYTKYMLRLHENKQFPFIPSQRELGIIAHRVLERVSNHTCLEDEIQMVIKNAIEEVLEQDRFFDIQQIWNDTIYNMIISALDILKHRRPIRVKVEASYSFMIQNIKIVVRCDRVEFYEDKIIIIDYKTGQIPSLKSIGNFEDFKHPQLFIQAIAIYLTEKITLPMQIQYCKISSVKSELFPIKDLQSDDLQFILDALNFWVTKYNNYDFSANTVE